jgi:hypothetical protein
MKEAVKFENGDPSVLRYEDVPDRGLSTPVWRTGVHHTGGQRYP